jgi:hypothetical protein
LTYLGFLTEGKLAAILITPFSWCSQLGAIKGSNVHMLRYYGIEIPFVFDLQKIIPNPTNNTMLSLYDLSNATIGINLEKNKKRKKKDKKKNKKKDDEEEEEELIFGW